MGAIDIHHHYVPQSIIAEAKRHGSSLGIEVSEDKDGTICFSFNGGPRYPLSQGLTDVEPRLAMMEKGKIALAALDPSTQLLGYGLKGEQAESWCRIYNDCVKEFLKKHPDRFTAMAAVPIQEPARAARVLEHAVTKLDFRGAYIATNVNHRYYDSEIFDPFWAKAQELPWRTRNRNLEFALRDLLAERPCDLPALTTRELANLLDPNADDTMLTTLTKFAKWLPLAEQNGREYIAFGRKMRGYTWKGQKVFV